VKKLRKKVKCKVCVVFKSVGTQTRTRALRRQCLTYLTLTGRRNRQGRTCDGPFFYRFFCACFSHPPPPPSHHRHDFCCRHSPSPRRLMSSLVVIFSVAAVVTTSVTFPSSPSPRRPSIQRPSSAVNAVFCCNTNYLLRGEED